MTPLGTAQKHHLAVAWLEANMMLGQVSVSWFCCCPFFGPTRKTSDLAGSLGNDLETTWKPLDDDPDRKPRVYLASQCHAGSMTFWVYDLKNHLLLIFQGFLEIPFGVASGNSTIYLSRPDGIYMYLYTVCVPDWIPRFVQLKLVLVSKAAIQGVR